MIRKFSILKFYPKGTSFFEGSQFSNSRGFTFIELLVSMTIIMLVGTVIVTVFFSALRGTDKSQSLIAVRQNGNFALSQIANAIRQAESINNFSQCSASGGSRTLAVSSVRDRNITTFQCSQTNISSNSANGTFSLLDETQVAPVGSCTFTCGHQAATRIPFVTISFRLSRAGVSHPEEIVSPVDFSTTVLLRNTTTD
jgi:Tfp pilus assembly protein PilW